VRGDAVSVAPEKTIGRPAHEAKVLVLGEGTSDGLLIEAERLGCIPA